MKNLPGIDHWNSFDRRVTTREVTNTIKILSSIRGVTFRGVEETESEGIYHLKFSVLDFGDFYLMYSDCDTSFAKEAKKSWSRVLTYVKENPNIKISEFLI